MQHYVGKIERILQTFALLGRSTSVTITGEKFESFFKDDPRLAPKVWAAFVDPPPGLVKNFIVAPSCRETELEPRALLTFYLNERTISTERDLKRLLATGVVALDEMPAEDFLDDPAYSAHRVADRVVHHSAYMCAVLLMPFNLKREKEIRAAIEMKLAANGSTEAAMQAAACPIVSASSLPLLIDTQRCNLIVDMAHRLGTAEHGQWVSWAAPLRERNVLQSVDLVAAADLASTRAGFCTVHELSSAPSQNEDRLRQLARHLLETRLGSGATRVVRYTDKKFDNAVHSVLKRGVRRLFIVSRLAHGTERNENVAFVKDRKAFPAGTFHQCALLGNDEFALEVTRQVDVFGALTVVVVLRESVAEKFNLRDWISFLAALPRDKAIVLRVGPEEQGDDISACIQRARLPRTPELTSSSDV